MARSLTMLSFIALVVLYLGNPSRDDFARFYADRATAEVARELGLEGPIGDAIGGAAQGLLTNALRERVHRRDWLVASVYTVPAAGTDPVWLGVAWFFVPIERGG